MDTVMEHDEFSATVRFFDQNGGPVVPSTIKYRIDDVLSGKEVRPDTDFTPPAAVISLPILWADTGMIGEGTESEQRRVKIVAGYGTDPEDHPRQKTSFYEYEIYRAPAQAWTSREELERVFGQTSVEQWADMEGLESEDERGEKIQWAVMMATVQARSRLKGAPCGPIVVAPQDLREMTTYLAGVKLYSAKGIHDAAEEDGRHRLKWHWETATKWFQKVCAGVIRIDGGKESTMVPVVVLDADDLKGADELMRQHIEEENAGIPSTGVGGRDGTSNADFFNEWWW